jgi:hypothetical protein
VINQEADRRLLAAFIHGLHGAPGRHLRMQMPENIDKALNMAIVATNTEREEKALGREERGMNARVFTVGGNRDGVPRGGFQWSHTRCVGFRGRSGQQARPSRVDGTYSGRTENRTPADKRERERVVSRRGHEFRAEEQRRSLRAETRYSMF